MQATADQPKAAETKPGSKPKPEAKPKPDPKDDLKSLPMPEVEKRLGSSPKGLSQAEAAKRLAQCGPNEIKEKKDNLFLKFLSYFWGPIPWMIEAAVILSGVVKHWLDFFVILFLLFSNALVAFWEEHQAGNEIAALRAKLATTALSLIHISVPLEVLSCVQRRSTPAFAVRRLAVLATAVCRSPRSVADKENPKS